jgi:type VI protein secretion system component VasK
MASVDWAQILAKIAAGGWPSWIASGVLAILGALFWWWYQRNKNDLAYKESQKKQAEGESKTVDSGSSAERQNNQAQESVSNISTVNKNKHSVTPMGD